MGTRIAIGILFILCLEQALTFEKNRNVEKEEMDQSRGKKKEKRATLDNAKILDAFSCEDGWTKMVKLPTHEDCERGGRKETESREEEGRNGGRDKAGRKQWGWQRRGWKEVGRKQ